MCSTPEPIARAEAILAEAFLNVRENLRFVETRSQAHHKAHTMNRQDLLTQLLLDDTMRDQQRAYRQKANDGGNAELRDGGLSANVDEIGTHANS